MKHLHPLLLILAIFLPACSPSCFLKPNQSFHDSSLSQAPDYSLPKNWAALPSTKERADFTPPGFKDAQASAPADLFFVYPTVWFSRDVWNDPLTTKKGAEMVDQIIMSSEASVFNGCCRVFAPRYRQTTLGAFYGERHDAQKSFEIAYDDVRRAFEHFLKTHNQDRPFILAGHSQGSMHLMRLIAERVDPDPELRRRLIAAYLPGFAHPTSRYGDAYQQIKPCEQPQQTGCIAAWDTYREGADVKGDEPLVFWQQGKIKPVDPDAKRQCTNPISWRTDGKKTPRSSHLGAVMPDNKGEEISFTSIIMSDDPLGVNMVGLKPPKTKLITAQCDGRVLRVPDLDDLDYPAQETQSGNYHLLDYELFYLDIRHNAITRTKAWMETNRSPEP